MYELTLDCDPDMSTTGAPFGSAPRGGPRLVSGAVLLLVAVVAALPLFVGASGAVAIPSVVVGACCALALVGRAVRVARKVTTG
jgi:hypothetical protein